MTTTSQLQLFINNKVITGWTHAEIVAGVERIPRAFHLGVVFSTDLELAKADRLSPAGQTCVLKYGNDILLTGYVDCVQSRVSSGDHEIVYIGRGACEDIVDGSFAFYQGYDPAGTNLMLGVSVAEATRRVLAVSGVKLKVENHVADSVINMVSGNVGDTSYSAIELFNRQTGCLLYENELGELVMGFAGSAPASKTTLNHQYCLHSEVSVDLGNVHSDYEIFSNGDAKDKDVSFTPGISHNAVFDDRKQASPNTGTTTQNSPIQEQPFNKTTSTSNASDQQRKRVYRQIVQGFLSNAISSNPEGKSYQQLYADWYNNRQMGRAQIITVLVQGFRDLQGSLWVPNQMVNVYLPRQNIQESNQAIPYLVAECQYSLSPDHGTTTRLTLMPRAAYAIETVKMQLDQDIAAAKVKLGQ